MIIYKAKKAAINILLTNNNNGIFSYGPVFFYMQAFIIKHVAFSPFFFRLPVYICGVFAAMVLERLIFFITNNKIFGRIFLVLFFTNFLICGSLSCGRMEMAALFFVSLSLLFFIKNYSKGKDTGIMVDCILSGILFCLAVLTTPRSSFLYLLFALPLFKMLLKGIQTNNFKLISFTIIHPVLSFGIPYFIWYHPNLGNPFEIFNYITPAAKTQFSFSSNHIDLSSFIWFVIDLVLIIYAVLKKVKLPDYLYGFLTGAAIFIWIVIPWSYHHGIVVPFLIFIGVLCLFYIQQTISNHFASNILVAVFFVQLFFATMKYSVIWIDLPSRNSEALQKIIQRYIPQKSKVIGDYNYYYACINNNCMFRGIQQNVEAATGKPVPVSKQVDFLLNTYRGEYIIVQDYDKVSLQPFLETNKFIKIAAITIPEGYKTLWAENREKFGLVAGSFYNGSIYKRISP